MKRITFGIRAELKNKWERRVPLTPNHVEKLIKDFGAHVYVQPSTKRIFPDSAYHVAGARLQSDLSSCDVILGVKEVPVDQLLPNKTYMFFSHTHKGQPSNMHLLHSILDKKIKLLDYELLKDENQRRLVQFSRFAGYAGMIDGMHSLARRLLALGYGTPFLAIGMSYMYRCLADARLDVIRSGLVIQDDGLPKELGPMTFTFTGDGNVTRGALHVFKCLPHEWVSPNDLKSLYESKSFDNRKVYGCQVKASDYLIRKDGIPFERSHYMGNPDLYQSIFSQKIAPYTRFLFNGIFWDTKYPRLLTIEETQSLARANQLPLFTLADVSCDINGSIEFMSRATSSDKPYYMYDPITNKEHSDVDGSGIQIMSIDNLPTEMPLEASEYFGASLFPYVTELAKGNINHPILKSAAITTSEGKLTPSHVKLYESIEKYSKIAKEKKKILLLGSGYVAGPLIDYLEKFPNIHITVASNNLLEGEKLAAKRDRVTAKSLDVSDSSQLSLSVSQHDLVVSLIPASMHPIVAEKCIEHKKHMVTASYISPALSKLDSRAQKAGITIMNEIGLDPGIDHLTALAAFKKVKSNGGKIVEFISWCGGLPAPEVSDNPLGYKFSWSPQGVLLAANNPATFLQNSKVVEIESNSLLKSAKDVSIMKGFALEGYPNRDSLKYISMYDLDPTCLETMLRGTLRYKGFSILMDGFKSLGLLSFDSIPKEITNWKHLIDKLLGENVSFTSKKQAIAKKLHMDVKLKSIDDFYSALNWLDMFSGKNLLKTNKSYFDAFCNLLQDKLVYSKNERDMVIMHHEFGVQLPNGNKEHQTMTMVAYGDPNGYSAMAKTVGLPAAIATEMIINGQITQRGVIGPMRPEIYEPILEKLEAEGIKFIEKTSTI